MMNKSKRIERDFEIIWSKYPKKLGKKRAYSHYKGEIRNGTPSEKILIALENYKEHLKLHGVEDQFIQHGKTWFNSWEDWLHYKPAVKKKSREQVQQEEYERKYGDVEGGDGH